MVKPLTIQAVGNLNLVIMRNNRIAWIFGLVVILMIGAASMAHEPPTVVKPPGQVITLPCDMNFMPVYQINAFVDLAPDRQYQSQKTWFYTMPWQIGIISGNCKSEEAPPCVRSGVMLNSSSDIYKTTNPYIWTSQNTYEKAYSIAV